MSRQTAIESGSRKGSSTKNIVVVTTLRVCSLGFRVFGRSTIHDHSIAMQGKSGQKTAIIVGMLSGFTDAIDFETDEVFCQALVLAE